MITVLLRHLYATCPCRSSMPMRPPLQVHAISSRKVFQPRSNVPLTNRSNFRYSWILCLVRNMGVSAKAAKLNPLTLPEVGDKSRTDHPYASNAKAAADERHERETAVNYSGTFTLDHYSFGRVIYPPPTQFREIRWCNCSRLC